MNLAALLWIFSNLVMSFCRYGSHIVDPYSRVDRTREIYAVFLQLCGHFLVFLVIKPSVALAFLDILSMWVPHLRSLDIRRPRYGLFSTPCSIVEFS